MQSSMPYRYLCLVRTPIDFAARELRKGNNPVALTLQYHFYQKRFDDPVAKDAFFLELHSDFGNMRLREHRYFRQNYFSDDFLGAAYAKKEALAQAEQLVKNFKRLGLKRIIFEDKSDEQFNSEKVLPEPAFLR